MLMLRKKARTGAAKGAKAPPPAGLPVSPIAVANYLLQKGYNDNSLGLMNLVYICHGWHLAAGHGPLLYEPPRAHKYGPAFPSILADVSRFLAGPVKYPLRGNNAYAEFTTQQMETIDQAYDVYHQLDPVLLLQINFDEGTAARKVWKKNGDKNALIPDDLIKREFKEKVNGRPY